MADQLPLLYSYFKIYICFQAEVGWSFVVEIFAEISRIQTWAVCWFFNFVLSCNETFVKVNNIKLELSIKMLFLVSYLINRNVINRNTNVKLDEEENFIEIGQLVEAIKILIDLVCLVYKCNQFSLNYM